MVDCAEFLDSYSDFSDGCLPGAVAGEFEDHLRRCEACARYDRVIRGGVKVFQSLPALDPSPDFQMRLLGRLYTLETTARRGSGASVSVTMIICLVIGVGAWLPALRTDPGPHRLPPVVAHAPYHDFTPALAPSPVSFGSTYRLPSQQTLYPQGYLLETTVTPASLAPRPLSAFVTQR